MNGEIKRYCKLKRSMKLNAVNLNNIDEMKNKLSAYEYISFDIFDTLIKRDVQAPSDVFDLIERDYNFLHQQDMIYGFKKIRICAEKDARSRSESEEVDLETIYQNIPLYSEKVRAELKSFEEKIEYEICTPHIPLLQLYRYCIERKKKVYITSDMYLSEELIRKILTKCGICKYEKLYLSSKYKKTKRTGNLFECLLEQEMIKPKELVHIGDSVHSDGEIPKKKGIKTITIPRCIIYNTRCVPHMDDTLNRNVLNSFINNHIDIDIDKDDFYRFGYDSFGPLLWGFSKWLINELQEKQIDRVYFFSRDGWIIKKAFDVVNHEDTGISSSYIEVSRRSLKIPLLWKNCTLNNVIQNLSAISVIKITGLFEGMGLDINKYEHIIGQFGFDMDSMFDKKSILQNKKVIQLFEEIKSDIYLNSKLEYENVSKYLLENNVLGKIAVVDIGWSGGMQRNLIEILESMHIQTNVKGYYMGVTKHYERQTKQRQMSMKGYIFDYAHDALPVEKHRGFVGLFETFFLEQKGSVMNYRYNNELNKMEAVRYPYEYMQDGEILSEVHRIEKLQEGAVDFVTSAEQSGYLKCMQLSSIDAFENIKRYCGRPTSTELDMFADFHFYDEKSTTYLARPRRNLLGYLLHIKEFKLDLYFSGWKIGFLRKLFGLNIPFYQIKQMKDMMLLKGENKL